VTPRPRRLRPSLVITPPLRNIGVERSTLPDKMAYVYIRVRGNMSSAQVTSRAGREVEPELSRKSVGGGRVEGGGRKTEV